MNVTNPKVTIFFLAFLPAFADPARGAMTAQIAILGAVFIVATLLVFGTIALIAGRLGRWLAHSPRTQRAVSCTAGAIFAAMALRLLTSEL
jgi:threonine/homoserine/homoserine lactone efflux protein